MNRGENETAMPRERPVDFEKLKIIVTGTPKAGNTWIRHLLAALYQLPMARLNPDFPATNFAQLGPRWIGQQHYHPLRNVLEWGQAENVIFVTPVRHPGDVLVALRHHLQNQRSSALTDPLHSMLLDPTDVYGEHTRRFLETGYFLLLHQSIKWLRGGWAHPVRYEDLWCRPLETLRALTDRFLPMPERRLRHAIGSCHVDLMRSTFEADHNFVRKGGLGSWMEVLPPDIRGILAEREPYPVQFSALNYSMDPGHPSNVRVLEPAAVPDSTVNGNKFANGVPLDPILVRAYFDLPEALIDRWPDPTQIGEDSFFHWLNRPAAADPQAGRVAPVVTELAHYVYKLRPDVMHAFPDIFGHDRREYSHWFLHYGVREYTLDACFMVPAVSSWAEDKDIQP